MAKVRDRNRIPAIMRQIKRMNERKAVVGVFDDAPNLVRIAQMNEFGVDQPMTAEMRKRMFALAKEYGAPTAHSERGGSACRSVRFFGLVPMSEIKFAEAPREVAKMMAANRTLTKR